MPKIDGLKFRARERHGSFALSAFWLNLFLGSCLGESKKKAHDATGVQGAFVYRGKDTISVSV